MNLPLSSAEILFEGRDLLALRQQISPLLEQTAATIIALRDGGKMEVLQKLAESATDGKRFDMVTGADKLSEHLVAGAIKGWFPDDSVRGEEKGDQGSANSAWRWEIDPIDGTYNFQRRDESGISVGLLHNGKPVLGVLHFLHDNTQMYAVKGGGAFLYNCATKEEKPLKIEPGSSPSELKQCHMAWDIGHGDLDAQMKLYTTLRPHARYITSHACYPVSVRRVLANNRDAYMNTGAKAYDMAGSIAVAIEAGAVISGIQEDGVDLTHQGIIPTIVARNAQVLAEMLKVLRG